MFPDDPRHGTNAGYIAGCRLDCCRAAATRYHKARTLDQARGIPRKVPARGAQRRLQALAALGWTFQDMAARLGCHRQSVHAILSEEHILASRHRAVCALYDQLCMTVPEGGYATRARRHAQRRGWLPPLAWDDIDLDPRPPARGRNTRSHTDVDPILVERLVAGDMPLASLATNAERHLVVATWLASGRSGKELARLTGWKPERYATNPDGAAA